MSLIFGELASASARLTVLFSLQHQTAVLIFIEIRPIAFSNSIQKIRISLVTYTISAASGIV